MHPSCFVLTLGYFITQDGLRLAPSQGRTDLPGPVLCCILFFEHLVDTYNLPPFISVSPGSNIVTSCVSVYQRRDWQKVAAADEKENS